MGLSSASQAPQNQPSKILPWSAYDAKSQKDPIGGFRGFTSPYSAQTDTHAR